MGFPVVIIGAGVAGAKVAYELSQKNVDFVILEATDMVGGRLRREKITPDGPYIEEGANWVQGYIEGEKFAEFVTKEVKLSMVETDFDDAYFYRDGKVVSDDEADPVWERAEDAIADVYKLLNNSYDADGNIRTDMSVESALLMASGWKGKDSIDIQAMRFEIDYEYAVPASQVSMHELTSFYDPSKQTVKDLFVRDERGFRAIVTYLLNQAGIEDVDCTGPKLKLNSSVSKIVYDEEGGASEVELANGDLIKASAVVSTLPLGVLQESLLKNPADPTAVTFEPELPTDKRIAICKFDLADYTKMFIKFRHRIFSEDDPTFMIPLDSGEGSFINVHNLNKKDYLPGENMVLLTGVDVLSRQIQNMSKDDQISRALKYISRAAGRTLHSWEVESFIIPGWHNNPSTRGKFTFILQSCIFNDIRYYQ